MLTHSQRILDPGSDPEPMTKREIAIEIASVLVIVATLLMFAAVILSGAGQ